MSDHFVDNNTVNESLLFFSHIVLYCVHT